MKYSVEVWTFPTDGDEEPVEQEMVEETEFEREFLAMAWAWKKMNEGFFTRMWRR